MIKQDKEVAHDNTLKRKIKELGLVKIDKEEIKKRLLEKRYSSQLIEKIISKYDYYRELKGKSLAFYSNEYLEKHTLEELRRRLVR